MQRLCDDSLRWMLEKRKTDCKCTAYKEFSINRIRAVVMPTKDISFSSNFKIKAES